MASLFLYLFKIMKKLFIYFFTFLLITSCSEDSEEDLYFPNDYGKGTYFITPQNINFIAKGSSEIKNNIFYNVNGFNLLNSKNASVYGSKLFILTNELNIIDINNFSLLGSIAGFSNPQMSAAISQNRIFVTDKGESLVKEVDLLSYEIISEIETGENTSPSFIINKLDKSFVLNGGSSSSIDSTLITVTYEDSLVPLADFSGNLIIGYNPNSAVNSGNIYVLCEGVSNSNNSPNSESSIYSIYPDDLSISFFENLSGIFNAQNLIQNSSSSNFYFLADGGVYRTNKLATNINPIISINSNLMRINSEKYAVNDSTDAYSDFLFLNDLDNIGSIYKYNINLSSFVDTLIFENNVVDICFKN